MSKTWKHAGLEPPLSQILDDPIFDLLMKRDGVERQELVQLISDYQESTNARCDAEEPSTDMLKTGTYSN